MHSCVLTPFQHSSMHSCLLTPFEPIQCTHVFSSHLNPFNALMSFHPISNTSMHSFLLTPFEPNPCTHVFSPHLNPFNAIMSSHLISTLFMCHAHVSSRPIAGRSPLRPETCRSHE